MDEILEILNNLKPNINFENEKDLIEDRLLDSFDILSLISELSSVFEIDIQLSKLSRENLRSVDSIWEYINHLKGV